MISTNKHTTFARLAGLTTALLLTLTCALATAGPGFQYEVNSKVQADEGHPTFKLNATGSIDGGTITFERSDGKTFKKSIEGLSPGQTQTFVLKQPEGKFSYTAKIEAKGSGQTVSSDVEFTAVRVPELELDVDPDKVRIGKGQIPIKTNRPLDRIEYEVYDEDGKKVRSGTRSMGNKYGTVMFEYKPVENVGAISMVAYDVDGFWRGIKLEPFWVKIPHKEVIFEFGKATWDDDQEPKLEASLEDIREAMEKHRDKGLQMQLYIAGYTDTVGSKSANMKLSASRAKAIARWFRKNGLEIPVYYQGFGESALAVETPDETKEEKNRRVIYILGNARPPESGAIPRSNWRPAH
ncbi:MAG: OmpA family protein [Myxococcota bacterium]